VSNICSNKREGSRIAVSEHLSQRRERERERERRLG